MTNRMCLGLALLVSAGTASTMPVGAELVSALHVVQKPTFSARVEVVRIDVLVTENNQPIRGLRASDFEVLDNGVPQRVDFASFEQLPLRVVLAFDMSSSVAGERLAHLRSAGDALLNALTKEDQAALVTFSQVVALGSALTSDLGLVRGALRRVEADGDTALVDGTYAAMVIGESDVGRGLLIVFSDGIDTSSWLTPDAVLETAKRSDVVAYCVAVARSRASSDTFLRDLSVFTGGSLIERESTSNLEALFLRVLDEFRQRYLVGYSPRGVSRDGWHRIEVRVKGRRATVKARPGYIAGS